jgi:hypothetical protein
VNAASTPYDLGWVVLAFRDNAAQQRHFHDREGFTTAQSSKPFTIMAGSRAGVGALVMEWLALREGPYTRAWPRAARSAT